MSKTERDIRNRDLYLDWKYGYTARHLAEIYDLSIVQIYNILKKENNKFIYVEGESA